MSDSHSPTSISGYVVLLTNTVTRVHVYVAEQLLLGNCGLTPCKILRGGVLNTTSGFKD